MRTGAWSLLAKVAGALMLFIAFPIVRESLGPLSFGVWATLISLTTVAGYLDFGLGNGAMNRVASARAEQSDDEVASIAFTSFIILCCAALIVMAAGLITIAALPYGWIAHDPSDIPPNLKFALSLVAITVALGIPLNATSKICLGLGRGDTAYRWQTAGQLGAILAVAAAARTHPTLITFVFATVVPPLVAALGLTAATAVDLRPTQRLASRSSVAQLAPALAKEGLGFFAIQISAMVAFSFDLVIISAISGPSSAGEFAIVQRMFSVIPLALSLVWAPLWPLYRHALVSGETEWIGKTLVRTCISGAVVALISGLVLSAFAVPITDLWLGRALHLPALLLTGFVLWCVAEAVGNGIATYLNAASVLRFQIATSAAFAIACLGAKFWLLKNVGTLGVPWAATGAYVVTAFIPFILFRKALGELITQTFGASARDAR